MNPAYFESISVSPMVSEALRGGLPIVALESTVITHGLPYPQNVQLARDMEKEIRNQGAVPATIAILAGRIVVGISDDELEMLAHSSHLHKISSRDFAPAMIKKWDGGTTVAGTMVAANQVWIKVFATGGIGGVHRQSGGFSYDISADLSELARTPMIVVCAGAKAILDIPATLEYLETHSVPVVGFRSEEFPAFYSRSSGLPVSVQANSTEEIVQMAKAHWDLGFSSAVLVANPLPDGMAISNEVIDSSLQTALQEMEANEIRGQEVTPYLLRRVSELTQGASLRANLALLLNNANLAAKIASDLTEYLSTTKNFKAV